MRVLNLSEGFEPLRYANLEHINFKKFVFNGGEPHIKIDTSGMPGYSDSEDNDPDVHITIRITSAEDLILLGLAKNALENIGIFNHYELFVSYFPGARQDRVMVAGEPLSVRVYADYINMLDFDHVSIFDPHSDVTPALLNNCEVVDNHNFIRQTLNRLTGDIVLISPDAGASKKILKLAQSIGIREVVKCDKERDVSTGEIRSFKAYSEKLRGRDCLIVDDICDGGGTFLGLADVLKAKGAGKLYLAVSHGIFSKGFKELNKRFDKIFTTDSFPNIDDPEFQYRWDKELHKVTQIKLDATL